jgi:hypothetical protein
MQAQIDDNLLDALAEKKRLENRQERDENIEAFLSFLRSEMQMRAWDYRDLANQAELHHGIIRGALNGDLSAYTLWRIAVALEIAPEDIFLRIAISGQHTKKAVRKAASKLDGKESKSALQILDQTLFTGKNFIKPR